MQVPLKALLDHGSLKNLLLKYLEGKVIEKVFLLLCFSLKLKIFFHISMRICYLIFKNWKAKPHENAEFNLTANHATFGSFNLQCKFLLNGFISIVKKNHRKKKESNFFPLAVLKNIGGKIYFHVLSYIFTITEVASLFSSSFCLLVYLERFLQVSSWFLSAIFVQATLGKTFTTAVTQLLLEKW